MTWNQILLIRLRSAKLYFKNCVVCISRHSFIYYFPNMGAVQKDDRKCVSWTTSLDDWNYALHQIWDGALHLGCIFCDCDQIYAWPALRLLLGCMWLAGCQMTTLAVVSLISFSDTHQLELDNLTLLRPRLLNALWILIISSGTTKQSNREWRGWMGLMQERYSFCHWICFCFSQSDDHRSNVMCKVCREAVEVSSGNTINMLNILNIYNNIIKAYP